MLISSALKVGADDASHTYNDVMSYLRGGHVITSLIWICHVRHVTHATGPCDYV